MILARIVRPGREKINEKQTKFFGKPPRHAAPAIRFGKEEKPISRHNFSVNRFFRQTTFKHPLAAEPDVGSPAARSQPGRFGFCLLLIATLLLGALNIFYYDYLTLPPQQTVFQGETLDLPQPKGFRAYLPQVTMKTSGRTTAVLGEFSDEPQYGGEIGTAPGSYQAELSIGGLIPLKSVEVTEVEAIQLIPGGHSIGILLQTEGVTVVGHAPILSGNEEASYPAKEAGLQIGDFVTAINGQAISTNEQIAALIDECGQAGQSCQIDYLRNGEAGQISLAPVYCQDSGTYRIGLYVRDNTAGVGTLTFCEPESQIYGALGHTVSNLDHGVTSEEKGSIVRAAIQGIKAGSEGAPGEKLGVFIGSDWQGVINKNGNFGIFGTLGQDLVNEYFSKPIPAALISQVELGPAQIYTVLDGENIEAFEINIVKILANYKSSGKGMIIEVADEALIAASGGIVQGMSGSPIIQNGRLIGAVTHVFINNPERGYACFSEWMLEEAGLSQ